MTINNKINTIRIAVIGNAGSGKTTFARKLGKSLSLPIFHIDNLQWDQSWHRKSDLAFKKAHTKFRCGITFRVPMAHPCCHSAKSNATV